MGKHLSHAIKNRRPSAALIVALLALAVALGGVAVASIPGADGTINGCYNSQGSLRVIDIDLGQHCAPGENLLIWNATGPPGPSQAFEGFHDGALSLRPTDTVLRALSGLPTGDYALSAKLWVRNVAGSSRYVVCYLRAGTAFDRTSTRLEANGDTATRGVLAFDLVARLLAPSNSVRITCAATGDRAPPLRAQVLAYDIKIDAIKVGSVTSHGI